ncbi:hypothetical protein ERJ75_001402000 [Trypanosoma vivax]|nr:hypothetical protein TRVL_06828 [Trypanosoma vivax]KAH8607518.1 hypothetical protein ERJ75_001402000 [Trypanosoma vivax]
MKLLKSLLHSYKAKGEDARAAHCMHVTLHAAAASLWLPHFAAAMYAATDVAETLRVLTFHFLAITLTYYVAVQKSGDYLLIVSWVLGVMSSSTWGVPQSNQRVIFHHGTSSAGPPIAAIDAGSADKGIASSLPSSLLLLGTAESGPRLSWIVVSMLHGTIGGFLCKLKDLQEDRYYPTHTVGERLYVTVPFCTGQWFYFVLYNGWWGFVVENITVLLVLAIVGYAVLSYKLFSTNNMLVRGDVVGFFHMLFTTSFGVVFAVVVTGNVIVTMLVIPFLKSLFSLNALVSSLGIVMEVIVYERFWCRAYVRPSPDCA